MRLWSSHGSLCFLRATGNHHCKATDLILSTWQDCVRRTRSEHYLERHTSTTLAAVRLLWGFWLDTFVGLNICPTGCTGTPRAHRTGALTESPPHCHHSLAHPHSWECYFFGSLVSPAHLADAAGAVAPGGPVHTNRRCTAQQQREIAFCAATLTLLHLAAGACTIGAAARAE